MNKEYVYKDGKALIIDKNDNEKTVDYYDSLDEVLVQENLIEVMETEIKKLETETSKYTNKSKIFKCLFFGSPFLIFTFTPLIFTPIISNLVGTNEIINTTIFGAIKSGTFNGLCFSALLTIPGALTSLLLYLKEKELAQEQKGKKTQLKYLKRNLVEEKEYLEKLKENKNNSKEVEEFYVSKVDNKETLEKLKNFLSFYYNLGYNEEKYFKYYQQGKLDIYLGKFVNDVGVQFANQYFKEKELVLKRTRKPDKK